MFCRECEVGLVQQDFLDPIFFIFGSFSNLMWTKSLVRFFNRIDEGFRELVKFQPPFQPSLRVKITAPGDYIGELLCSYKPKRAPRSSSQNLLVVPQSNTLNYDDRAFQACAPKLLNSMSEHI